MVILRLRHGCALALVFGSSFTAYARPPKPFESPDIDLETRHSPVEVQKPPEAQGPAKIDTEKYLQALDKNKLGSDPELAKNAEKSVKSVLEAQNIVSGLIAEAQKKTLECQKESSPGSPKKKNQPDDLIDKLQQISAKLQALLPKAAGTSDSKPEEAPPPPKQDNPPSPEKRTADLKPVAAPYSPGIQKDIVDANVLASALASPQKASRKFRGVAALPTAQERLFDSLLRR